MELVVVQGLPLHIQVLRLSVISNKDTNESEVHLVLAQQHQKEQDPTVEVRTATPLSILNYLLQL